jgi:hypothetical protein
VTDLHLSQFTFLIILLFKIPVITKEKGKTPERMKKVRKRKMNERWEERKKEESDKVEKTKENKFINKTK